VTGRVRAGLRLLGLAALTALSVVLHLATRLTGRHSPWPRRYLGLAGRIAGMDVSTTGTPRLHDVFYIANHVSWLDILVLAGRTGCAFVARDDLGKAPLVGWLAAQNNTILIRRHERSSVDGQIAAIRKAIAEHQPVCLFPEGTTGDGVSLLPFKAALFAVLLPPPRAIQVQPVFIDYGEASATIAWTGDEGGLANALRILGRKGRTRVVLHFLDAYDPGDHPDRKTLSAQTRARIESAMAAQRPSGNSAASL